MAEHLSLSEIEEEAKKLKRDLENWREIILPVQSVLLWEKNSHLAIIFGSTSAVFFLLWQSNPSVLSIISLLGMIITVVDYLVPLVAVRFHHPEKWTSAEEKRLESICQSLAANKIYFLNFFKSFYEMKRTRPKFYYTIVLVTFIILSWIGNAINNLFLTYLVVMTLLLLPGAKNRGLIEKYTGNLYKLIINLGFQDLKRE